MARAKISGLGKAKGDVGGSITLDDGDYLVEIQTFEEGKSKKGDLQYTVKMNILDGPEQESGKDVQGMPWTVWPTIIEGHEYEKLMVNRFKNLLNAFRIDVRQDSVNPDDGPGKRAVMRIKNKADKETGEWRSEVQKYYPSDDPKSPWKDAK
jgi:hypothetical protein